MRWSKSFSTPRDSSEGRLLDGPLLAALVGLSLPTHRMRGALPGMHPGSSAGAGEDFFQHRPYGAGEDVRAVDWRASARLGHLVVKERHRPLRQPLLLLLDASASMQFPADGPSKHFRARQFAAALALLALRRGDPVHLDVLGPRGFAPVARALPAGRATLAAESLLSQVRGGGRGELGSALLSLGARSVSGKHLVVLSDLYGSAETVLRGVEGLVRSGAAVTVVQVLSENDRQLPADAQSVRDAETGATLAIPQEEARALGHRVDAWQALLRTGALRAGAEWVTVESAEPPGVALRAWLGGNR